MLKKRTNGEFLQKFEETFHYSILSQGFAWVCFFILNIPAATVFFHLIGLGIILFTIYKPHFTDQNLHIV